MRSWMRGSLRRPSPAEEFEREVLSWLGEVVDVPQASGAWAISGWHNEGPVYEAARGDRTLGVEEGVRGLRERFGDERLRVLAAEAFFDARSIGRDHRYGEYEGPRHGGYAFSALLRIAAACMLVLPPEDLHLRMEDHLRHLARDYGRSSIVTREPNAAVCSSLLRRVPLTEENLALAERALRGEVPGARADELFELLYGHDRLPYELFLAAVEASPGTLEYARRGRMSSLSVFPEGFLELLFGYYHRFVKAFLESPLGWPASHYQAMFQVREYAAGPRSAPMIVRDARHLLAAAELLQHRGELREGRVSRETVTGLASKLARQATARVSEGRSGLDLVRTLREYPRALLLELLPRVGHPACAGAVATALGGEWERSRRFVELLVGTAQLYDDFGREHRGVDPRANSPDQDLGVLDAPALRLAWEEAGPFREEVLRLYREAGYEVEGTLWLMEPALGEHRQWIAEKFEKRKHPAVKALGTLPIEGGSEEVRERYAKIRRFEREGKQFGSQRRATEGAAAAVALKNLATNAGYPDVRRLSWAMAAEELSGDGSAMGSEAAGGTLRRWSLGDYEAEIVFEEESASVRLLYHRGEKTLKSVPRAVKQSEGYPEMKEALAGTRREVSSLRKTLEEIMASGETLSREDLRVLWTLPVGRYFLQRLILLDERANIGLPEHGSGVDDPSGLSLGLTEDYGGAIPLQGRTWIAHPYHLYAAGPEVLSAWQREVVRRNLVQPMRQAFRELYLPTGVERDLRTHSTRFSDHVVVSRVTARLLESRGWDLGSGEGAQPEKTFRGASLVAAFEFDDVGHYFTELDTVVTGPIRFFSLAEGGGYGDIVPVDEVPPTVFSEVLRDADLVVSVAQAEGEGELLSEEGLIRRAELLSTLVGKLGVPGVSVSGRFARVSGKLADYRVHLGSGAVHVEPAGHLCIVPASRLRGRRPLLPFAEETEANRKAREVVSKVLLLARDEKIQDESILAQIRRP